LLKKFQLQTSPCLPDSETGEQESNSGDEVQGERQEVVEWGQKLIKNGCTRWRIRENRISGSRARNEYIKGTKTGRKPTKSLTAQQRSG